MRKMIFRKVTDRGMVEVFQEYFQLQRESGGTIHVPTTKEWRGYVIHDKPTPVPQTFEIGEYLDEFFGAALAVTPLRHDKTFDFVGSGLLEYHGTDGWVEQDEQVSS